MCKSDVIISDGEVYAIEFPESDVLLAMSQEAFEKYLPQLKKGGTLIVDSDLVITAFSASVHNEVVSKDAVCQAIRELVLRGTGDKNIEAFEKGYKLGSEIKPHLWLYLWKGGFK